MRRYGIGILNLSPIIVYINAFYRIRFAKYANNFVMCDYSVIIALDLRSLRVFPMAFFPSKEFTESNKPTKIIYFVITRYGKYTGSR